MAIFIEKYFNAKNIIFIIIAILFVIFLNNIKDIAIMFFASFVISCSLEPAVAFLSKKFKRNIAAAIVLFLSILFLAVFLIPVIVLACQQINTFADSFPVYLNTLKGMISTIPFINKSAIAQIDVGDMVSSASGVTSNLLFETVNLGKNIGSGVVYLIAAFIIMYYFMADKELVRKTTLKLFPKHMQNSADEIIENISKKVGGYVIAQIITMASVGVIMAVGLSILGVDYALMLGLMTAVLDIIPIIGPGIALIICLIISYKAGATVLALIVLSFAIAQLAENNLIRPYIFGKLLDIHPLIIYFFLFVTAKYLGIIGVVFAPAIAATVVVLTEELYIKNISKD